MKALTLHQPWASLVALGVKTIETRSWSTPHRGPLAIHAGKSTAYAYAKEGDYLFEPWYFDVQHRAQDCDCEGGEIAPSCSRGAKKRMVVSHQGTGRFHDAPLGAVVAVCTLADVVPIIGAEDELTVAWQRHIAPTVHGRLWLWKGPSASESLSTGGPTWLHDDIEDQRPYGDFAPGRYAWLLDGVEALAEPVPARGRQGLWSLPAGLVEVAA